MAHIEQKDYCLSVKAKYPEFFVNKNVLDVGSLDINGNNRYLFDNSSYVGLDIGLGPNVDIVSLGHEYNAPDETYDVIISTECFEHDRHYEKTIKNILRMLKSGGMFIFTCATTDRPEHGTNRTSPQDAPLLMDDWSDYYKNLTQSDIEACFYPSLNLNDLFLSWEFETNNISHDLYFYGIKK